MITSCLVSGLTVLAVACGGDDAAVPAADQAAMPAAPGADAAGMIGEEPTITRIHFRPDAPVPGDRITAQVQLEGGSRSGAKLEFSWEVGGSKLPEAGSTITVPELKRGEAVRVSVVATNSYGDSSPRTLSAKVENQPPRITNIRLREGESGDAGAYWMIEVEGSDPDGDAVEYSYSWLINGRNSDETGDRFPTSKLKRGDEVHAEVVASDGRDESDVASTGTVSVANSAPDIVSTPPRLDAQGRFEYAVKAQDADGDRTLRYELVSGPVGMRMDDLSGRVTWKPTPEQAGEHRVEIAVDDRRGGRSTQVFDLAIVVLDDGPGPANQR
jgi:hypothetical protein